MGAVANRSSDLAASDPARDKGLAEDNVPALGNGLRGGGPAQGSGLPADGPAQGSDLQADGQAQGNGRRGDGAAATPSGMSGPAE